MLMFPIKKRKASYADVLLSRQTILSYERQLKQAAIY